MLQRVKLNIFSQNLSKTQKTNPLNPALRIQMSCIPSTLPYLKSKTQRTRVNIY
jgi:hypothetical protein